ncbi:hypothetical protein GCM10023264_21290 [Sphingomonas daechungensis]|uniref:Uncharacterized protein n=1 Tax=Sphingomonas daechungensis TaxID=1176646 RepID=A0ABX6T2V9_9SPHN|nr:hypothetical protein [Sphingomonas daechungensis]QNP43769.1 hypothetical protein H9L15_03680 [Sphingomonas daechungensis]
MLSPSTYWAILILVSVFAFWRGRADERIAAVLCIAATIATHLVYVRKGAYEQVEMGIFLVDAVTFAGFALIALRSERFWPLWLAGLQLTTVGAHAMKAVQLDLMPQAYGAAARFWAYPIFMVIVLGTWRSSRRRRAIRPGAQATA